ncbi:DUF4238 domain-containing protein [Acholeplasma laidlawii]|uniref:DUF4238 domain-containing protein n=1 Tax=Acholeplasma laidlawii TaxID=2148 RepID=UPI0025426972|nr:DUF4238 domain-containing protein [Acholeplasma laidlawii]
MTKVNNHLLPRLIIRNWEELKAVLYDKKSNSYIKLTKNDFAEKYYYSLGEKDDKLETRISKFETRIGHILKKIKESNTVVSLSGKEIELLKLFCYLSACRQHNTSAVIKSDQSGIYKNNNYLFGTPLVNNQKDAVDLTDRIIDEFERIQSLSDDAIFDNWTGVIFPSTNNTYLCQGMHLSIIKSSKKSILVSDICAIIECTMDSDYLYTYIPISPEFALLLVKSKYYQNMDQFEYTKRRFGNKYGLGTIDPYISEMFYEDESVLFDSCSIKELNVTIVPTVVQVTKYNKAEIVINSCNDIVFKRFNSIMYEDGNKILVCKKEDLNKAKSKLNIRKVTVRF